MEWRGRWHWQMRHYRRISFDPSLEKGEEDSIRFRGSNVSVSHHPEFIVSDLIENPKRAKSKFSFLPFSLIVDKMWVEMEEGGEGLD